jgi:XTP/dITP diphosphohydrolase
MTLYAATSNPGKLLEFTQTAAPSGIAVLPLPGLATMPEPVEDAPTFLGNAEIKAVAYSRMAPGLVLCDDSGIELPALDNRPGVRSARFADDLAFEPGPISKEATKDDRNNRALLAELARLPNPGRAPFHYPARFVCALAIALRGHVLLRSIGILEGLLLEAPRGASGFGYDPLFLIPSLGLTLAELPPEQKWQLSHRGNAFRRLLPQLDSLKSRLAPL